MLESICSFCRSFNINDLKEKEEYREELRYVSDILRDGPGIAIASVLEKYVDPQLFPDYKFISGIASLDYLVHPTLNKKIYLLGDVHTTKGECSEDDPGDIHIGEWISKITETQPLFVDVFIEHGRDYIDARKGSLRDTFQMLKGCIPDQPTTNIPQVPEFARECPPNTRVHYADFREKIMKIAGLENYLKVPNIDAKVLMTALLRSPLILKEGSKVKTEIRRVLNKGISAILQEIIDFPYIKKENMSITIRAFTMDVYVLYRMFKEYDVSVGKVLHPHNANNCIFFGGGGHAFRLKKILEHLGFNVSNSFSNFSSFGYEGGSVNERTRYKCLGVDIRKVFE